jgi:superfamily II DNA or RNA helicase
MTQFIIGNIFTKVKHNNTAKDLDCQALIHKELRYEIKNTYGLQQALMRKYKGNRKAVYSELDKLKWKNFYNGQFFFTGFLDRVIKSLDNNNIEYEIQDTRNFNHYDNDICIPNIELRDYQKEAIEYFLDNKRGILGLKPGRGKTITSLALVQKLGLKTLFITHKKDLLHQTYDVYKTVFDKIGIFGDGLWEEGELIDIATIQTLSSKAKKFEDEIKEKMAEYQCVIVDECHHASSDQYVYILSMLRNASYRIGLTGTPYMKSQEENMYVEGLFGGNIFEENEAHQQTEAKLYFHYIACPDDNITGEDWHEIYKNAIVENDYRNAKIIQGALEAIKIGLKVLIIVERIEHGEILYEFLQDNCKSIFVQGKDDSKLRKNIIKDLNSGKLDCVIATDLFNEGVDIPELNCVILAAGGKSNVGFYQRIGRATREKTDNRALIIDFYDKQNKQMTGHSVSRYNLAKSKNATFIKKISDFKE